MSAALGLDGNGHTIFDRMRLERAELLRTARKDPNDRDAANLESWVASKVKARAEGSTNSEDWT